MQLRKELIKKHNAVPAYNRYEIINCCKQCNSLRDQALICFLYLSACRIEELVKFIKDGKLLGEPIVKNQIEETTEKGVPLIRINGVRCLKQKKKRTRTIPLYRNKLDVYFFDTIKQYLDSIVVLETRLWDFTRQRGHQILSKVGLFPHLLRHARVTHLVRDYDFSVPHLQMFTGWSRSDTAMAYTHLNIKDIINKLANQE